MVLQSLTRTPSMICFHTKIVYFPVLSHTSTSDAFSQIFSSSQIQSHSYFLKMHVHAFFLPLTPSHVLIHNALYSLILSQTQTFYLHRHQCNPTQICTSTYYFHFAFEDTLRQNNIFRIQTVISLRWHDKCITATNRMRHLFF